MKRMKKIVSTFLIVVMSAQMVLNVSATSVEDAQKKANELEAQKETAKQEQNSLSAQLNTVLSEMTAAKEQMSKKEAEVDKAETDLIKAKVDENEQYESMKKRIKYMYENGNVQFIEVLLSCENITDFLNKAEYVSQVSAYDRDMLVVFRDTVKEVEAQEAALKDEYEALSVLQTQLVEKQNQVQTMLNDKNIQLSDLEGQIGANAVALQTLLTEAAAAAQRQKDAAAAAQAAQNPVAGAGNGGGGNSGYVPPSGNSGYVPPSGGNIVTGSGYFTNPCPGASVSSTFGYRDFDSSFHNGLDLAAGEGTPTYAAAAGTVVTAGWSNSAGNWVVINHGDGFVTKYMHHSALAVSEGQTVSKGQPIGYVGNTGNSFGAHLHFQVELNSSPVDPQSYL